MYDIMENVTNISGEGKNGIPRKLKINLVHFYHDYLI